MATDVDVQFFSHLNGLNLGNNWGDLIRLLDKALVTGIDFTQITATSIDEQGDVHITLYSAHNAMLFQVVELTGFAPASLNQKYRIKGVPSTTKLILKPHAAITETSVAAVGSGKLASLGYEIIFRDSNDVKRVYRAKNPTAQHPFIRVDETISDGVNNYGSTYAKYAMIGLLEHMSHIDDYENPAVLQLPFDPANPAKNWKITGTGTGVIRGWGRWYWSRSGTSNFNNTSDSTSPAAGNREFTLCGDCDAFYLDLTQTTTNTTFKALYGCGLINSVVDDAIIPPWYLMCHLSTLNAGASTSLTATEGGTPLTRSDISAGAFYAPNYNLINRLQSQTQLRAVCPDDRTGYSDLYSGAVVGALEIPVVDAQKILRGSLKHLHYAGNINSGLIKTSPLVAGDSMYVWDTLAVFSGNSVYQGGVYFYIGELE
jgi:hypothetical protein